MNIGSDVSTDVQVLRLKNSREPIVIETKTTTTTTTVTKRICIANDANIDIADIQSLINDDVQTHAITTTAEFKPKSNGKVTSNFDSLKSPIHQIESPLSSTKIEDFGENNEKDSTTTRKKEKKKNDTNFISPNLSKIPAEKIFKRTATNIDHTLKKEKASNQSKMDSYSTRSKKVTAKPQNDSTGKENYIDGLISKYMTLEKKPRQKNTKKPKAKTNETEKDNEKGKKPEKVDFLPAVQNDLSAIFENPFEENDLPMRPVAENASTIDFDGGCNGYFDDEAADIQPHNVDNLSTKETVKKSSKVSSKTTESSQKIKRIKPSKPLKPSKKNETKQKASSKKIQAIKSTQSKNNNQTPIMIYSPSTQKTLTSGDDNKLILTKDMIEKKMKKYPNSSKSMMERFERFKEMRVDADSRVIFYPESKEESDSDDSDDSDILKHLRNQSKGLLVKEYLC